MSENKNKRYPVLTGLIHDNNADSKKRKVIGRIALWKNEPRKKKEVEVEDNFLSSSE